MNMYTMYFPEEVWNRINRYAGFITMTINWDLTKLPIKTLVQIIKKNINNDIEDDNIFQILKRIIPSLQKYLIQYFWENINKTKILEIYQYYSNAYCSHNYVWYNHYDVYLLTNYKRKISFQFNGKVLHNKIYLDKPSKVIDITNKSIELVYLDKTLEKMQQIMVFNLIKI